MSVRDRIGYDASGTRLEDAIEWAAESGLHYVDFNADTGPNDLRDWSDERVRAVRDACQQSGIHLGLHTLSAVNIAEFSPCVSEAADSYLRANIDFANRLGCEWVVIHAGYHFSAVEERKVFNRLESAGYRGHYMMAFGSREDKPRARDFFASLV